MAAADRGLGGLHERGALARDPVEVGAHGGVDGGELRGQIVQEGASDRRVAAHERKVLGREHDRSHDTQDLAGPHLRTVNARPIRLAAHDFQLDDLLAA